MEQEKCAIVRTLETPRDECTWFLTLLTTTYLTLDRLAFFISSRSFSLPGVAIQHSTPRSSAWIWAYFGDPPKQHILRIPRGLPNFCVSSIIWHASSRVGASTSKIGPLVFFLDWICWWNDGRRKPHVFPLPVLAMHIKSTPLIANGHAYVLRAYTTYVTA